MFSSSLHCSFQTFSMSSLILLKLYDFLVIPLLESPLKVHGENLKLGQYHRQEDPKLVEE